ncbi:MAG: nucleoside hydrolase [Treponema sp.]|nr:nucleoside hydrolase [Treponema sp.]
MKKIILDVDTGSDDAIAVIAAVLSKELNILGITTVSGNQSVKDTTENTLRIMDVLNSDVPVYKGCSQPLVANLLPDRHSSGRAPQSKIKGEEIITYHSKTFEFLPPSKRKAQDRAAVLWIVDTLMASDGDITFIGVGPATNLALAMRIEPQIKQKLRQIIVMGGGYLLTNTTASSEFNVWEDPEAMQIVFTSGCDILLVPLDATHAGYITTEENEVIKAIGTPHAMCVYELLSQRIKAYDALQPMQVSGSTPPHDALAVCAAIDEHVLRGVISRRVDVDFGGNIADGMTVLDQRIVACPPNLRIALDCDREKFVTMLTNLLDVS